jgi:alginate O-acetyltransferase complex protein AlgI
MLFNSVQFVQFFIVIVITFYIIPFRFRWLLLLLASCYFYMVYIPVYILILALTITIDYFVGLYLEKTSGKAKKLLLIVSIVSNIGILCFFKYYNFFTDNINFVLNHMGYKTHIPPFGLILPIGLSFHTFQALSYIIEVYRGNYKAEKHFGIYALYVMFFPQLVAGPIERPQNIIYQFYEHKKFDTANIAAGLKLMIRGFFKKLVVADRLALYVNAVYNHPNNHNGNTLTVATLFFAFQIYCDFSGYSDIALGAAKVMGFDLMVNFKTPFFSKNITEFWRRWHVSLSTWFNDYLFNPLVIANRNWGKFAVVFALIVTFFVSGLWHGAGWSFIIYGLLHGLAVCYEFLTKKIRKRIASKTPALIYNSFSIALTFIFVAFAWIFFRASNINTAWLIIGKAFTFNGAIWAGEYMLDYCLLAILILLVYEITSQYFKPGVIFKNPNYWVRNLSYAVVVLTIIVLGVFDGGQFIYFQF